MENKGHAYESSDFDLSFKNSSNSNEKSRKSISKFLELATVEKIKLISL